MKHRGTLTYLILVALLLAPRAVPCAAGDELEKNFATPPDSAKPWVWWHWMNGNITKEGITADLEEMHRVGIGGVNIIDLMGDGGGSIPKGPVEFGSREFWELLHFAVAEAGRLGMVAEMNPGGGWSSGGPWITPELSMQRVVFSETPCEGGRHVELDIPQPPTCENYYRDIAVWAYPSLDGDGVGIKDRKPKVTTTGTKDDVQSLFDGNYQKGAHNFIKEKWLSFGTATAAKPVFITLEFPQPQRVRSFTLGQKAGALEGVLEASEDGATFKPILSFRFGHPTQRATYTFEEVSARFYRVRFNSGQVILTALDLTPRLCVEDWAGKVYDDWMQVAATGARPVAVTPADCLDRSKLVNLSGRLTADNRLAWDAPPGRWTILRIGTTLTGQRNRVAREGAKGLESDKFSAQATDAQWQGFTAKLLDDLGPLAGRVFKSVFIDSYEDGYQNWTPRMVEEFRKRRGYDPLPFLPVLCNRYVDSAAATDRFAWDFRRTCTELMAENYTGRFSALCQQRGLEFAVEPYGPGVNDSITYAASAHVPMTEFWFGSGWTAGATEVGVAHIYGRRIIGAEAFTGGPAWQVDPYDFKMLGDKEFAGGINLFKIHSYAHQPWTNPTRLPGMTFEMWGCRMQRTVTWWNQAGPWLRYVARCQYLLRQGLPVADVCGYENRSLPAGYKLDPCNYHAIENRLGAADGRIVLPDGMSYRFLTLEESDAMTPATLKAVRKLVEDGATVVGPKPLRSPSLQDYPRADQEIAAIANEVWGDCDGKKTSEHIYGKGRVVWGKPLGELLKQAGIIPDFRYSADVPGTTLMFNHRQAEGSDIYFVANRGTNFCNATCTFRVSGKVPELWHPDTGRIESQSIYQASKDGGTDVPLRLDPFGSVFVVFCPPAGAPAQQVTAVKRDGMDLTAANVVQLRRESGGKLAAAAREPGSYALAMADGSTRTFSVAKLPEPQLLAGPWELTFPPNWGAPERVVLPELASWTGHSDAGVRYFSGTASYHKRVTVPESATGAGQRTILDLGRVKNLAQVFVNGRDCGVLWKEPFSVDITDALRAGDNDLEIRITNLWPNRMIGDEQLPADPLRDKEWRRWKAWPQWLKEGKPDPTGRLTFTTYMPFKKDSPLLESGLLGPVMLRTETWMELK